MGGWQYGNATMNARMPPAFSITRCISGFVQRQRRVHFLVEIGLDASVIARVDQLRELVGNFRVTIRPLS